MPVRIAIDPIPQIGHICKPNAVATIEQHYAKQLGFEPIPLRKQKIKPFSIRQLAKRHGSVQGELLEIDQLQKVFTDLGYQTQLLDFNNDYELFRRTIIDSLKENNFLVACFAVNRSTGLPQGTFDKNEHAAIINGFDEQKDTIHIVHWGRELVTTFKEFYLSSQALPQQRQPEYYYNVKSIDPIKKYHLSTMQNDRIFFFNPHIKKSITPKPYSGFRSKLLTIKKPSLEQILTARNNLLSSSPALKSKIPHHMKPSLSNKQITQIRILIKKLEKEVRSCWPYPNKDLKTLKINGLKSLLQFAQYMDIQSAVMAVEKLYPNIKNGTFSTRTADLLYEIKRSARTIIGSENEDTIESIVAPKT